MIFRSGAAVGTANEIPYCWTIPSYVYDTYGFASPPGLRCRHPSLYFQTDPDFTIIARFFDSESGIRIPVYARRISFDLSIAIGSSAYISAYDLYDQYLNGISVRGSGVQRVDFSGLAHKLTVSVPDSNSKFAIDNLSFELFKLIIEQPTNNQTFDLNLNRYRETEVAYKTNILERGVEFTTIFQYSTSGNKGLIELPRPERFNGNATDPVKRTYTAKGGKLTVDASFSEGGITSNAKPVTCYIVGSMIPDSEITARLYSLYRGVSPDLLTGIAMKESSYKQFTVIPKYDITARWPIESAQDGGSHIGLMQVETTYERAWDWLKNTDDGATLFIREKLPAATRNERRIRNGSSSSGVFGHPGLRKLTEEELENMAVLNYGQFTPGTADVPAATLAEKLAKQYYIPVCKNGTVVQQRNDLICQSGTWEWTINSDGNPLGVDYVDKVRAFIR